MAHGQHFRAGYTRGLLFGAYLERPVLAKKGRMLGNFLIMGACQNIWI